MSRQVAPIPCKPWTLNGLSEHLMVSHYEDDYGAAVRSLNAIRNTLNALDLATAPGYQIRALKREELVAESSVVLHEVYFGSLGGDGAVVFTGSGAGSKMPEAVSAALEQQFGGIGAWRREFTALARTLAGTSGWVLLNYSRRDRTVSNQIALENSPTTIDAAPLLALDMYEHAYRLDFGANASAYIEAFIRNIDWAVVAGRLIEARGDGSSERASATSDALPSISVEELSAKIAQSEPLLVVDARARHGFSRSPDMMKDAIWHDPDYVEEWSKTLSAEVPVFVYCSYGFHVGCGVAAALRERGFDARYIKGGLSAWYAAGGGRALKPQSEPTET